MDQRWSRIDYFVDAQRTRARFRDPHVDPPAHLEVGGPIGMWCFPTPSPRCTISAEGVSGMGPLFRPDVEPIPPSSQRTERTVMADEWFEANGRGSPVDVVALFDSKAAERLFEVVQLGALASIGTTRDGGALGVTITADGKWRREYFRDAADLCDWLGDATEAVRRVLGTPEAPRVPATRKRGAKTL